MAMGEISVNDLAVELGRADTREVGFAVTGLCTAYGARRIVARGEGLDGTVLTAWGASLIRSQLAAKAGER